MNQKDVIQFLAKMGNIVSNRIPTLPPRRAEGSAVRTYTFTSRYLTHYEVKVVRSPNGTDCSIAIKLASGTLIPEFADADQIPSVLAVIVAAVESETSSLAYTVYNKQEKVRA